MDQLQEAAETGANLWRVARIWAEQLRGRAQIQRWGGCPGPQRHGEQDEQNLSEVLGFLQHGIVFI